jgi:hypothetical protein
LYATELSKKALKRLLAGEGWCQSPRDALTPDLYPTIRQALLKTNERDESRKVGVRIMPLGQEIVGRINVLAAISETPEHPARIFLTRERRAAAELILEWMRESGMRVHLDAIGKVC